MITLGLPTMVGMMVSSLYNLVDTYFVGVLGTSQQAAVSAVYPLGLIALGLAMLFGCGGGSYVTRLLGKKQKEKANACASTALFLAIIFGMLLAILMLIFINPILQLLGCTDTMKKYAIQYAIPFIIGLAINIFNGTLSNLATAEGQPIYSMRAMMLGGITNIILDPLFIIVFKWGVLGASIATLISRFISMSIYLYLLLGKKSIIEYSIKNIHFDKDIVLEIFKIGIPNMIFQLLMSVSLSITNILAKPYGDSAIAACGIVSRVMSFGFMIIMGFMKGYQPFVGFNFGAKKYDRVTKATNITLIWSTSFCIICSIILIVFRIFIIRAFNADDPQVLLIGSKALIYNAITFITLGFQTVYNTKFMGLGKAIDGSLISLGRQGFFFIPVIFVLTSSMGLDGLILARSVADILSMILVCILVVKNNHSKMNFYK